MSEFYAGPNTCSASRHVDISFAEGLRLSAAPIFALMALLTFLAGGATPPVLCLTTHDASPLTGMAPMYLLMAVFHSTPWLTLISARRRRISRS